MRSDFGTRLPLSRAALDRDHLRRAREPEGLLSEPGDVDMLAQQLLTLNQAPQRLDTMRRAAFERGRSQFTFDRVCQQTLELYRQLLSPATAPRPTE